MKNSTAIPTWIIAIVSLLTFLFGFFGKAWLVNDTINEYKDTIEYLKIPGENPKLLNDFEFKVIDLTFIERAVAINVLVTSKETTKKISFKKTTRLIDNFGNIYKPIQMQLGRNENKYYVSESLPANIGIAAQFKFENLSSKATGIKFFEIDTSEGSISFTNEDFIKLDKPWIEQTPNP